MNTKSNFYNLAETLQFKQGLIEIIILIIYKGKNKMNDNQIDHSNNSPALREGGNASTNQDEAQGQIAISEGSPISQNKQVQIVQFPDPRKQNSSIARYFQLKSTDFRFLDLQERFGNVGKKEEKSIIGIEELNEHLESGEFQSLKTILRNRIKVLKQLQENDKHCSSLQEYGLAERLHSQIIQVKKRTGKIPQWIRDLKDKNIQVYDFLVSIYDKMYPQPEEEELHNHDHDHDHEHDNEEEQDGSEQPSQDSEEIDEDPELTRMQGLYCKFSLSKYEISHPMRRFCIRTYEWPWFDRFIILLVALNSIFLGVMDYTYEDGVGKKPLGNKLVDNSEILFTVFFTFECFVKIMALGLIMDQSCYLRDMWNWLDFIVVVAALIQNLNIISNVSSLRTFRLFRPLRTLSAVPSMKILVNTLFQSSGQLVYIIVLDMFFILTFAIFGLQMWGGVMHFRCRETQYPENGDWKVINGDEKICGGFHTCPEGSYCGSLYETLLPDENGNLVQHYLNPEVIANMDRDTSILSLNYGLTNFDNIGTSFLSVFQCTSLEGWSTIMIHIQDGYSMVASSIFFVVLVIFCSYLLINLTVAVMHDNFLYLNQEKTDKIHYRYEMNQEKVLVYTRFAQYFAKRNKKRSKFEKLAIYLKKKLFSTPELPEKVQEGIPSRYDHKVCLYCYKIINHPIFSVIIMVLIIMNTLILATDSYPAPEVDLINSTNKFFMIAFSIECILKLTGLEMQEFLNDNFNIFDLVIVLFSIIELFFSEANSKSGVISALRAFRLLRLIKLVRSNETLAALVDSIVHTIAAIGNFLVLLSIFIYVFALLGMSNFAGKFKFDKKGQYDPVNGEVPRENFDSIFWAVVTVFQVLIGDDWNQVMYKAIRSKGHQSVNFFIMLVLVGNFIMFNLFLAILLGNFEQASMIIKSEAQQKILDKIEGKENKASPSPDQKSRTDKTITPLERVEEQVEPSFLSVAPFAELVKNSPAKHDSACPAVDGKFQCNHLEESPSFMQNESGNKSFVLAKQISSVQNKKPELRELQRKETDQQILDSQAGGGRLDLISKKSVGEGIKQVRMALNIRKNSSSWSPQEEKKENLDLNLSDSESISGPDRGTSMDYNTKQVVSADIEKPQINESIQFFKKNLSIVSPILKKPDQDDAINTPIEIISSSPIKRQNTIDSGSPTPKSNMFPPVIAPSAQTNTILAGIKRNMTLALLNKAPPIPKVIPPRKKRDPNRSPKDSSFDSSVDLEAQSYEGMRNTNGNHLKKIKLNVDVPPPPTQNDVQPDTERNLNSNREMLKKPEASLEIESPWTMKKAELRGGKDLKFILPKLDAMSPSTFPGLMPQSSLMSSFNDSPHFKSLKRVLKYIGECSLFFLHKDTIIRQFLLRLTTQQHDHDSSNVDKKKDDDADSYDQEEDNQEEEKSPVQSSPIKSLLLDNKFGSNILISNRVAPMEDLNLKSPNTFNSTYQMKRSMSQQNGFTSPMKTLIRAQTLSVSPIVKFDDLIIDEDSLNKQLDEVIKSKGSNEDLQNVLNNEVKKKTLHIKNLQSIGKIDARTAKKSLTRIDQQQEEFQLKLEGLKLKVKVYNKFRKGYSIAAESFFCLNWNLNKLFENTIYLIIFISMIHLIIDGPGLNPEGTQAQFNRKVDDIISTIFIAEVLLRILALGFFTSSVPGQKGYITKDSNKIDFVVSIGCDTIIFVWKFFDKGQSFDINTLRTLKVLRVLRALRPLRIISKSDGLKLAVSSLFTALPAIANGILICTLVIFIYAIIGISLFKGQFYYCNFILESKVTQKELIESIITKEDCLLAGGDWMNRERNFDSIMSALLVLQEIITTEGWLDVMYHGIDSTGLNLQPKKNHNLTNSLFFISFIITGNIFVLNLFVGIVIDKFNRLKDKICGYMMMTRHQKDWVELEKQMVRLEIEPFKNPPENPQRLLAYKIQMHKSFENFIYGCMFVSTLQMALRYYQMDEGYSQWLDIFNYIFTFIYNLEAGLKIFACGHNYFLNNWNKFDFFIVIVGNLSVLADIFTREGGSDITKILRIIKALRIMRIFRLVRVSRKLRILVDSLIVIFPSIANIGSLIMLLLFIFSIIGMSMFSHVIPQTFINENMNFSNFSMSIVILIRCATGENWNLIMRELAIQPDKIIRRQSNVDGTFYTETCQLSQTWEELQRDGPKQCGTNISFIYFGIFIVVVQFLMVNLFVAVVLEGFSSTNKEHTGFIHSLHFEEILEKWTAYDEDATGWIKMEDISFLVHEVSYPLGRMQDFDQEVEISAQFVKNDSKIIDQSNRFFTHIEKNMTVRFSRALKLMMELKLPVYLSPTNEYQCHFSDVIKALSLIAMKKEKPDYDNQGILKRHLVNLKAKWEIRYPDLIKRKPIHGLNSGKVLAGTFIVRSMKNITLNQKIKQMQNQAFNLKAMQEQNLLNKLESKRKSHVIEQLKIEKKMTSIIMSKSQSNISKLEIQKILSTVKVQNQSKEEEVCGCQEHEKVKEPPVCDGNLGFSSQLINDKDFAQSLDEILHKGTQYRKLGIRIYDGPRIKEKVKMGIGAGLIENYKKRYQDAEQTEFRAKQFLNPDNDNDQERSTWWQTDPVKNYKMARYVKNLEYKAQKKQIQKKPSLEEQKQKQESEQTGGSFIKRKETFGGPK